MVLSVKDNKAKIIFWLLFLCLSMALEAGAGKEKSAVVRVTGIVRLVGSAPMSEIVITGETEQWYIARKEARKLMDLQHRIVTIEGAETVVEMQLANGTPAGERRTLSKIKIISIQ